MLADNVFKVRHLRGAGSHIRSFSEKRIAESSTWNQFLWLWPKWLWFSDWEIFSSDSRRKPLISLHPLPPGTALWVLTPPWADPSISRGTMVGSFSTGNYVRRLSECIISQDGMFILWGCERRKEGKQSFSVHSIAIHWRDFPEMKMNPLSGFLCMLHSGAYHRDSLHPNKTYLLK